MYVKNGLKESRQVILTKGELINYLIYLDYDFDMFKLWRDTDLYTPSVTLENMIDNAQDIIKYAKSKHSGNPYFEEVYEGVMALPNRIFTALIADRQRKNNQ